MRLLPICALLIAIFADCRSWGKFWQAPTFVEIAYDAEDDFHTGTGFPTFKLPLPTGSSTWRLDSKHKIKLRLRYPNNGYSNVAEFTVRKGNNRDINGETTNDQFGISLALDDFNGDGKSDPFAHAQQVAGNSKGYIFLSQNGGLAGSGAGSAQTIIPGEGNPDFFGAYSGVYDLNGDGSDDLIVGAFQYSAGGNTGRVYVFVAAGQAGISASSRGSAAAILTGEGTNNRFGRAIPF